MLTAQLMSQTNAAVEVISPGYQKGDLSTFSVQFFFSSGTLAGSVSLDCSNDNTHWIQVTGTPLAITGGESAMINVTNGGYRYVRAHWTPTAGTGNITADLVILEPSNRN